MPVLTLATATFVLAALPGASDAAADGAAPAKLEDSVAFYSKRYPVVDTHAKLVSNRGKGYEPLTGVRNFRKVLNGLVYRGGANNAFRIPRTPKFENENPLPPEGIENLCKESFSLSFYMYEKNYNNAEHIKNCTGVAGQANIFSYLQTSVTSTRAAGRSQALDKILSTVYEHIEGDDHRPIYLHCWNGWHASGFASAIVLRQFCGMSGSDAVKYWDQNTEGVSVPSRRSIHRWIRDFTPDARYGIGDSTRHLLCDNQ